jgi:hypothetical protein
MKYVRLGLLFVGLVLLCWLLQSWFHLFYERFSDGLVLGKTELQIKQNFGNPVYDSRHPDSGAPPEGPDKFHFIYFYDWENINIEFVNGKATHVDHGWK